MRYCPDEDDVSRGDRAEVEAIWKALTLENKRELLHYLYDENIISREVMDPISRGPYYVSFKGGSFQDDL